MWSPNSAALNRQNASSPKACRNGKRIDPLVLPPGAFITTPVELTMVQPANRNGVLVANLSPHRALLGKFEVMGV
jgi:hypothetical protein